MRKFKSFGSPVISTGEPVEFELYGATFRCQQNIQGRKMLTFIAKSDSDEAGASATAMVDFLDNAIIPEHREAFRKMTESDETIIPMETLTDITTWLIEIYSGNSRKEPSDPSLNGHKDTPSTSEESQLATT